MPRFLLALSAVTFAAFGLAFAIFPEGMGSLVGVGAATPSARADVAATYGGLELGVAAFLAWCLARNDLRTGLTATLFAFLGLGSIRLAWLLMGGGSALLWVLVAAEALGVVLAAWGLRALGAPSASDLP